MGLIPYRKRHYRGFRNLLISLNSDLFLIEQAMGRIYHFNLMDEVSYHVIAIEDRRFFNHGGVDIKSLLREFLRLILRKKHGGASTIDMQLVRTITGFKDQTLFRKLYEIVLSILVNYKFSKERILQCYLENAFFGSGLIGVDDAAFAVFGKLRSQLNQYESAFISAMLLRPKPLKANQKWVDSVVIRARYAQKVRMTVKQRDY